MITIGNKFPDFEKKAVYGNETGKEFITLNSASFTNKDVIWTVMFWWPKDFTFICPTELIEFNKSVKEFRKREARLIGASTDSEYVHLAWKNSRSDLKAIEFPMLADTSKSLAEELGILEQQEKVAYRTTYIIDPDGIIRWVSVNDLNVGRNVQEVIRVLDALQTGELCPCNWEKGHPTLS